MDNPNLQEADSEFPNKIEKLAIFVAIFPFLLYYWNAAPAVPAVEGIYNIGVLVGGIITLSMIPLIFLLHLRKLPAPERTKHLLLMLPLDAIGVLHLCSGLKLGN